MTKIYPEFEDIKFIKKRDKVSIIGFAPSWNETPWEDPDMDFWGINELYMQAVNKRFDAWFEVHNIKESPSKQQSRHQNFLKNCKIPLITQKHWDDYPSSIAYPREYIKDLFNENFIVDDIGGGYSDYSNQISWMIALAIALHYKEIHVYGVDMAQHSEYAFQRASCQFFIGYAAGAGIKLKIPKSCELIKCGADYGFSSDNSNRFRKKSRITTLSEQMRQYSVRQSEIDFYIEEELRKPLQVAEILLNEKIALLERNIPIEAAKGMPINNMQEELKKTKQELLNRRKDTYINIKLLEEESESIDKYKHELTGLINECKHDLNNNLV